MLANYLKTALRNLLRQRTHLLINSGGLAVGMACALLMSLYIRFELSYDRFHTHHDRIYRITSSTRARQPVPLGPLLLDNLPAVEATTSIKRSFQPLIIHGDERFFATVHFVEANFFEFFDFPLLRGKTGTVLTRPHTMVISRQLAERYFGEQDPIGARLSWDGLWDFEVTGVADTPTNSHFQFEILASVSSTDVTPDFVSGKRHWGADNSFANRHIYLRLGEGQSADGLALQALDLVEDHVGAERVTLFEREGGLQLQRLTDIHLHSQLAGELGTNGQIQQVYLAAAITLFVLLIACVNYVNLATARSAHRAHEVGVRKALGARRGQLIAQFLGESGLLALSSLVLALCVGALSLPTFARFSTADLSLSQLLDPTVLLVLLAAALGIGLLAGLYPAFFLSASRPVRILRGSVQRGRGVSLRKALIVAQFALSIIMTVATGVVYHQLQFLRDRPLGFSKDQIVVLAIQYTGLNERAPAIHQELLQHSRIHSAASFKYLPSQRLFHTAHVRRAGQTDSLAMTYSNVEAGFVDLMQLQLLAGRSFSLKRPAEQAGGLLLNRAATRALGYATPEEAIGEPIAYSHSAGNNQNAHVWGVVEDFHFESLHNTIRPMMMNYAPWDWAYSYSGIRIDPENTTETIGFIEDTWDEFVPEMPIQWHFLDTDFERLYRTEQRLSILLASFAAMAIAIACMGVWALTANAGERRTKEIGVRKVLGASEGGIVVLLAREFATLAIVANLLAWPLVYWVMDLWLESFAHRAEMAWWLFVLGSVLVLACAMIAAVYQALQAARIDPVQALRWE